MGHCWAVRGEAQTSPGTVWSSIAQSSQFSGRRVCSIIHASCYFHHMLLSGVIVIPATSARTALYSYCYRPSASLRLFTPITLFHYLMELALEAPLTGPLSRVWGWGVAGLCCRKDGKVALEPHALFHTASDTNTNRHHSGIWRCVCVVHSQQHRLLCGQD